MNKLTIIKIGGKLLDDELALQRAMTAFSKIKTPKILVHGGGKRATELCVKLGIEPKMNEGRRITDAATLEVATMVYAGLINKKLVGLLQHLDCNAMGLCGADGNLIIADKRPVKEIDYGWVGDVKTVNTTLLARFLAEGVTPVFCAITHNGQGQLLNTNADTIATEIASAMSSQYDVVLKYCFEKEGVLSNPADDFSVMPILSKTDYLHYRANGVIYDGMIPKLDNAFAAKQANISQVFICGESGIAQQKGTEICL